MSELVHIPPVPTSDVSFTESGNLTFKALLDCAYDIKNNAFAGGEFRQVHFSHNGWPAWIRLEGAQLIIEELTNCLIDKKTGNFVGGEMKTLLKLNLK